MDDADTGAPTPGSEALDRDRREADPMPDETTTARSSADPGAAADGATLSAPGAADTPAAEADGDAAAGEGSVPSRRRRRGSRGGQRRRKGAGAAGAGEDAADAAGDDGSAGDGDEIVTAADSPSGVDADGDGAKPAKPPKASRRPAASSEDQPELPDTMREGRADPEAAERALVRKPQIGDTRPAPGSSPAPSAAAPTASKKSRRGRGRGSGTASPTAEPMVAAADGAKRKAGRGGRGKSAERISAADAAVVAERRGQERNGRAIGRYLMGVQVREGMAQVAVLEGRNLIEHYVSRPADDISQVHGNIYVGRVQNVLPGMEAAFVDIATPKNAVLYRGDVQYDAEDIEEKDPRIENILRARQLIVCQVTKNPIGAKGARLTQEVSLPGRYVVLIPNSKTYGISKRLPDDVRKRLRGILDRVKPAEHGLIVRTAAEHATEAELAADMRLLLAQWEEIAAKAAKAKGPTLLYREPELAVRVIREEFNADYRSVVIDDKRLYEDVKVYVSAFNPELADRIEYYDAEAEGLGLFEYLHVHEQVHKALDRKVWLPSGGSLIIEHTEALTVIDVNTGKNVGTSSLEETVFHNNLEAAEEIAKQLRLRDIGGIIVIDFIDMEIRDNREKVVEVFRNALARDKTRSQVFAISDLGLVEMTRKRIGEGLLTEFSSTCTCCDGRGVIVDHALLD
jgi:ribonuclease E